MHFVKQFQETTWFNKPLAPLVSFRMAVSGGGANGF